MNRLVFLLCAKNQYNIQSPFLFELYTEVIAARLDDKRCAALGIGKNDRYGQLRYKLADHYGAHPVSVPRELRGADDVLRMADGSLAALVQKPHHSRECERRWKEIVKDPAVTLSVDLYDVGLLFTSKKLSKQHFLLR